MTAKEMFEKLGYEFELTKWKTCKPDFNYISENGDVLYFDLENKQLIFWPATRQFIIRQPIELLQAINKQVEELGWNGSDNNE